MLESWFRLEMMAEANGMALEASIKGERILEAFENMQDVE